MIYNQIVTWTWNSCDFYYSGYDVGGYIVGDVMLDDIGEVVSPIAGLSIISVQCLDLNTSCVMVNTSMGPLSDI